MKPRVQKLRSSIHRSLGSTVRITSANRERSCAWPSSHGMTSMARPNAGSSTTRDLPGKAAAVV